MVTLRTPLSQDDVRNLKVGDIVLVSGNIVTGRDKVHKLLARERPDAKDIPFNLEGGIIYHCGPIMKGSGESLKMVAAGPTTSTRMEVYAPGVIKAYGIRGIIGKGGMGEKTLDALREHGCVYLHGVSGAAVYLADRIKRIVGGWKVEEFGMPEAMWLIEVEDFPAIVTMDAHGNSLHKEIENISAAKLKDLWKK